MNLGRKEGSRKATCVYIAVSGTGSPPCHVLCVLFGSGHPLSGTTQVASDVSQSTLGCLCRNTLFKEEQMMHLDIYCVKCKYLFTSVNICLICWGFLQRSKGNPLQ